jgi:hypothetical protein
MGDRPGSFLGCAQVRTKVCRKDYGWSMGLVYDPRGLSGVTTARPRVAGVLQRSDGEGDRAVGVVAASLPAVRFGGEGK